jgi:O-antigen/teichoic acid export membrane protein
VFYALTDQGLVSGTNFLHVIATARCLSVEDFGLFSLCWVVMQFLMNIHASLVLAPLSVLFAEFSSVSARLYLKQLEKLHALLLLFILPAILVSFYFPGLRNIIIATALAGILRSACEWERRAAYVRQSPKDALFVNAIGYGPLLLVSIWLYKNPQSFSVEFFLLAAAVPAILGWAMGRKLNHADTTESIANLYDETKVVSFYSVLVKHFDFGRWVLLSTLAMYSSNQLYPFLIAGFLGLKEVAAMSAAKSLLGITHIVMAGLDAYIVPIARSTYVKGGWSKLKILMNQVSLAFFLLLAPIVAVLLIWANEIISLILKPEYADTGWVLRGFCFVYVLAILNRVLNIYLQAIKEPKPTALSYGLMAIFTLTCGPIVVNKWGLSGVIGATAANALILTLIAFYWLYRMQDANLKHYTVNHEFRPKIKKYEA